MPRPEAPRIALAPEPAPGWMAEAISDGGGHIVPLAEAEAIVWADPRDPDDAGQAARRGTARALGAVAVRRHRELRPPDRPRPRVDGGKGVYAEPVAELALTLALAGMRGLGTYARASSWTAPAGREPARRAGHDPRRWRASAESLVRLLQPCNCHITVVRRTRERPRRRRRRAGGRPLRRRPPRCRPRGGRARADPGDRGHHRRRRARADGAPRLARQRGARAPRRHRRPRRRAARRGDRWRRARRHRSRAAAARSPAVVAAELPHHPPRRQHAGDGGAAARRADHGQRAPLRRWARS